MALAILDGTQTATTLSTILSSGQHITAHTVVSLGTQAKTDILSAVSSGIAISGTVTVGNTVSFISVADDDELTANISNAIQGSALPAGTNRIGVVTIGAGTVTIGAGTAQIGSVTASISGTVPISISSVTVGNSVTISSLPAISGTVTVGNISSLPDAGGNRVVRNFVFGYDYGGNLPVAVAIDGTSLSVAVAGTINGLQDGDGSTFGVDRNFPVDVSSALPAGTNRIGVVTIGAGTVTIGAGTQQIGSVTASLAISSTAITSGSFSSLTSATIVPGNTARKMATVYNLGAGQLFVNAGATATTLGGGFMVALSSGDFYECDYTTTTLSAIFATAGTASWVSH